LAIFLFITITRDSVSYKKSTTIQNEHSFVKVEVERFMVDIKFSESKTHNLFHADFRSMKLGIYWYNVFYLQLLAFDFDLKLINLLV